MNVNIVIADDHPVILQGIAQALLPSEFKIVAEARKSEELVNLCRIHQPQVTLVDIQMPDFSGLDALPMIKEVSPHTRPIVVSMYNQAEYINTAFQHGAVGYIHKSEPLNRYPYIIRLALEGKNYISPEVSHHLINLYRSRSEKELLSSRELEVLKLIGKGLTSREIAEAISISPTTVDAHRTNLIKKLGLNNKADLIRYAFQNHIL